MVSLWCNILALLLSSATKGIAGNFLYAGGKISEDNLRKIAVANNDLALNIYQQLSNKSSENIFFSPLSLSTAFGMLYYGAKGQAAKELKNVLGYETAGIQENLIHRAYQKYLTKILPSQDPSAYVLNSANAIFLDKNFGMIPSYKRDVQNLYQALVQDVDFQSQAYQILEDVNSWVRKETNGKIDNLLQQLDPSSLLILLNAVYFKGTWETQFDRSETRPETFYNSGLESGAKKVPMMRLFTYFPYAYDSNIRVNAVEMDFKGGNISMVILVPYDRDGLELLEKSLTLEKLSSLRKQMVKIPINLIIPKFKIEYSKEMSSDFAALGAESIFSPGADFSGMTSAPNAFVTQILHKAVIEVNEEGSEAAAISGVILGRNRYTLTVDYPFLFTIIDKRNDMILFLGRVTNL